MIPYCDPSPTSSFPTRILDQAAELYRAVLLPDRYRAHAAQAPDSPPEAMLACALGVALAEPLRRGALELHQRVHVRHPIFTAGYYEIDIRLRQPATGAEAWIDPSSWKYKDRSEAEYEYGRRRYRELSGICRNYVPYATSEVTSDVWGCVGEILERIGAPGAGFAPLDLPDGLLPHLRRLSCAAVKSTEAQEDAGAPRDPSEILSDIRRRVSVPPQGNGAGDGRTHPRSTERYSDAEIELLKEGARAGLSAPQLARAVQRSDWAVSLQLERLGVSAA